MWLGLCSACLFPHRLRTSLAVKPFSPVWFGGGVPQNSYLYHKSSLSNLSTKAQVGTQEQERKSPTPPERNHTSTGLFDQEEGGDVQDT